MKDTFSKEYLKKRIRFEIETNDYWSSNNFLNLNEPEWNALLDNLYYHFKKMEMIESFYRRVGGVLYHSLKANFYTLIPDVTINQILNNLSLLDPEFFDYETLEEMRNKIRSDIEAKKVIKFDPSLRLKRNLKFQK